MKSPANQGRFEKEGDVLQTFGHYGQNELTMRKLVKDVFASVNNANFGSKSSPCGVTVRLQDGNSNEAQMAEWYIGRSVIELAGGIDFVAACKRNEGDPEMCARWKEAVRAGQR